MRSALMVGLLWAVPAFALSPQPSIAEIPLAGKGEFLDASWWQRGTPADSSRVRAILPALGQPYAVTVGGEPVVVGGLELGHDVTLQIVDRLVIAGRQSAMIDNAGTIVIDADAIGDGLVITEDTHLFGRGRLDILRGSLAIAPGRTLTMHPAQRITFAGIVSGHSINQGEMQVPAHAMARLRDASIDNLGSLNLAGRLTLSNSAIHQAENASITLDKSGSILVTDADATIRGGRVTSHHAAPIVVASGRLTLGETRIDRDVTIHASAHAVVEVDRRIVLDGTIELRDASLNFTGKGPNLFGTGRIVGRLNGTGLGPSLSGSARIARGIELAGTLTIDDDLIVSGTLAPGDGPDSFGIILSDGSVTLNEGSVVELDISSDRRDTIDIAGTLAIKDGSSLKIRLPEHTEPGEIITLISAGSITGAFGSLEATNARHLDLSLRYLPGRVELVLGYCRADANENGSLDAGDFGAWLKAFNAREERADQNRDGLFNASDYAAWLRNFERGCG